MESDNSPSLAHPDPPIPNNPDHQQVSGDGGYLPPPSIMSSNGITLKDCIESISEHDATQWMREDIRQNGYEVIGDMPLNTYLEVAKINVLVVQLKERLLQVLTTYVPKKRGLREGEEEEGFST
ncbi:hypothetical protein NLI96_g2563 [Meripilus lineatus]|uniref:Uncharacterized protein n=1 Tax=Meripilus lineatus TaxID=2056292 RepID=A0AAD5V8E9_9APHY|nr:hypothetical protein NLI96_g2563 [Physisporinus lineatus]